MLRFSPRTRRSDVQAAEQTHFDLIVVGGGINGAGVLRDASLRGLKCLVIEKDDFASGTSSKSSKLIHGGLRYLKHFDFLLTRESCVERNLLTQQNPHLVEPIPFLFPIYETDKEGPFLVGLGMWIYEALSSFNNYRRFKMLKPSQCKELAPDLDISGLKGAAYYYDAWADDARLVLESIKSGVRAGGVAFNHMEVTAFEKEHGSVVGVKVKDHITGETHIFHSQVVLNATGTWVDATRGMDHNIAASVLKPTKGVHIVVPRERIKQDPTLAFSTVPDRRLMFSIPWGKVLIIGTTDTHYEGSRDEVTATTEDVDYILAATNRVFPDANLTYDDVISTFAGLRPLVAAEDTDDPGAISREHQIFEDPSGLISIAGGKLTTYRLMARELVDRVIDRLPEAQRLQTKPCVTDQPICGVRLDVPAEIERLKAQGFDEETADRLIRTYGPDAYEVLAVADELDDGRAPIQPGESYLRGELIYAARREAAYSLADVLTRRLRMALWTAGQGLEIAEEASRLLATELGWSEPQRLAEVQAYVDWIARHHRPVPTKEPSPPATPHADAA